MKLIALKDVSAQWPKGGEYEFSDEQARALIALGVAKAAEPIEEDEAPSRRRYLRRDMKAEA